MESSTPPVAHIISEDDEVWTAFMQFTNMEDCTLYVPNGSAETYRETLGWKDFTKIEEYE